MPMTTPVLISTSRKRAEDDANAAHLSRDVRKRHEDRADDGNDARGVGVVPVSNEVRHGELAELSKVGREQQREQDVAAGPAHEVNGAVVPMNEMSPAILMNDAALIQSAPVAMPLTTG